MDSFFLTEERVQKIWRGQRALELRTSGISAWPNAYLEGMPIDHHQERVQKNLARDPSKWWNVNIKTQERVQNSSYRCGHPGYAGRT